MGNYLVTDVVRIFEIIAFTFGAGLSVALAIRQRKQKFRIWFLLAFAFMSFGVMSATFEKLALGTSWNWAISPFIFASAILVVIAIVVAYKDHFR